MLYNFTGKEWCYSCLTVNFGSHCGIWRLFFASKANSCWVAWDHFCRKTGLAWVVFRTLHCKICTSSLLCRFWLDNRFENGQTRAFWEHSGVKEKRETSCAQVTGDLTLQSGTGMHTEGQQGSLGPVLLKTTLKTFLLLPGKQSFYLQGISGSFQNFDSLSISLYWHAGRLHKKCLRRHYITDLGERDCRLHSWLKWMDFLSACSLCSVRSTASWGSAQCGTEGKQEQVALWWKSQLVATCTAFVLSIWLLWRIIKPRMHYRKTETFPFPSYFRVQVCSGIFGFLNSKM